MPADGRLRELHDGAELRHRQLAPIEQQQDPAPRGVGQRGQVVEDLRCAAIHPLSRMIGYHEMARAGQGGGAGKAGRAGRRASFPLFRFLTPSVQLESWRQVELEHPVLSAPLERTREVELADGEANQVDAEAAPALATPSRRRRGSSGVCAVPRDAAVGEERDLDRHWTVHPLRRTEGPQEREPELEVCRRAYGCPSVGRSRATEGRHAFARRQRVDVVAANQSGIADVQRNEPPVLAAGSVPPVVQDARRNRVERAPA